MLLIPDECINVPGAELHPLVSQTLAHRLWPRGNVIGEIVLVNGQRRDVVGMVEDVRFENRATASDSFVYVPYWRNASAVDARFCVRVSGDPAAMLPLLTRAVHSADPNVPLGETITLPIELAGGFQPLRMSAVFVSYNAGLAMLLSTLGVYGALVFADSRRRSYRAPRRAKRGLTLQRV